MEEGYRVKTFGARGAAFITRVFYVGMSLFAAIGAVSVVSGWQYVLALDRA